MVIIENNPPRSAMLRPAEALELLKFLQYNEALLQQVANEGRAADSD